MAPTLLGLLVAGMHQLDLGASRLLLRAAPAALALERGRAVPQVGPQALGAGHQRGVHRQRWLAALHAQRQLVGLAQRVLRKGAAVIAGVLVKAHVQPALGLGQVVIAQRPASVAERLQARLQRLVGLLVGVDGGIGDAVGRRIQRDRLRGGLGQWCAAGQGRAPASEHGQQERMVFHLGILDHLSRARSRLRLTLASSPRNSVSSNLKRSRRKAPRWVYS